MQIIVQEFDDGEVDGRTGKVEITISQVGSKPCEWAGVALTKVQALHLAKDIEALVHRLVERDT